MNVQLAGGVLQNDKPLFSVKRQQVMWSMVTSIPIGEALPLKLATAQPNFAGYRQGWTLINYLAIAWFGTPAAGSAWCGS